MQCLQVRIGTTLYQFISKTQLGADFMVHQMIPKKANAAMIRSMVDNDQILFHQIKEYNHA